MSDVVDLAKALIACPSVTPVTAGVFDVMAQFLEPLGFTVERVLFEAEGTAPVENLYARYGSASPNFCFAGHTDVVPAGDLAAWRVPPFAPEVIDGELIGRGAEDMKGAIAAFMIAARDAIIGGDVKGSLSFLITQDEEGPAINGTRKLLDHLKAHGEVLDACIVGEPTNPSILGEMAKIGRRGSIGFTLEVQGKQGHVAYPALADNPITRLVTILHRLKTDALDAGSEFFPPSNLEVTSIDVGNPTSNMIPANATAQFNVRFNDQHTGASVEHWVRARLQGECKLAVRLSGESFLTRDERLAILVVESVREITGRSPALSTTGGTSDARFIKDVCPVIEFGTTGRTSHMINESVEVKTLEGLAKIYQRMIEKYFA